MDEVTIVRDKWENKWHLRFIEAGEEDLGITLCGDGDGWDMKRWDYENAALIFQSGCHDCILGLALIVQQRRDHAETERHLRAILTSTTSPTLREHLTREEQRIAQDLLKEGVIRKETITYKGKRRVAYYGTQSNISPR